jgi:hypothetical protein
MIRKRISIKKYQLIFISRNYWDKGEMEMKPWSEEFKDFHLGLFFNKFALGNESNILVGINLLIIKSWIVFSFPKK